MPSSNQFFLKTRNEEPLLNGSEKQKTAEVAQLKFIRLIMLEERHAIFLSHKALKKMVGSPFYHRSPRRLKSKLEQYPLSLPRASREHFIPHQLLSPLDVPMQKQSPKEV